MKVKTNYNKYLNLWSTDNARTEANDNVVIKSVYDPSPVGYSLPASNAFTGFTTTGQNVGKWDTPATPEQRAKFNVKGNWDKGYYFYRQPNKQGNIFWFPASGRRYLESGRLREVTTNGWCWLAGPNNMSNSYYLNFASEYVFPLNGQGTRSDGFPVRSAEEKETHKFNIKPEMDGQYYNLWSTDTIGLQVLFVRTAVATWISARATSTHCTAPTVVTDTLFAAQRRSRAGVASVMNGMLRER